MCNRVIAVLFFISLFFAVVVGMGFGSLNAGMVFMAGAMIVIITGHFVAASVIDAIK
jgi:hypothetical protein